MTYYLYIKLIDFPVAVERHLNPHLQTQPVVVTVRQGNEARIFAISPQARHRRITRSSRLGDVLRRTDIVAVPGDVRRYWDTSNKILHNLQMLLPGEATNIPGEFVLQPQLRDFDGLDTAITHMLQPNFAFQAGASTLPAAAQSAAARAPRNHILRVDPGQEIPFWNTVPITWLPQVGPRRKKDMLELGIRTVGDFLALDNAFANAVWGPDAVKCRRWLMAEGSDTGKEGTVSRRFERVFPAENTRQGRVLEGLDSACQEAASWLRQAMFTPLTLWLSIRYPDGGGRRGRMLLSDIIDDRDFLQRGKMLLKQLWTRRVRLERLEVVFIAFPGRTAQRRLFDNLGRQRIDNLGIALDKVRGKYGYGAINYASSFQGATER